MKYIIKDFGVGEVKLKDALLNIIHDGVGFELTLDQLKGSIIDLLVDYDFEVYIKECSSDRE